MPSPDQPSTPAVGAVPAWSYNSDGAIIRNGILYSYLKGHSPEVAQAIYDAISQHATLTAELAAARAQMRDLADALEWTLGNLHPDAEAVFRKQVSDCQSTLADVRDGKEQP